VKLDGRVALVTGGTRGLGREFADALATEGADVAVLSRSAADAQAVAVELRALGRKAVGVGADVTDRHQLATAVAVIEAELGPIDVLVNNAGICIHADALDVTFEDWRRVLAVNVDGVWNCSQLIGRGMVARGRGSIINIGSMSGIIVNRPQNQPAYNTSKAAVHHLTKSLAAEWAPFGVRVNAVAPGYVRTEMTPVDDLELAAQWTGATPLARYAEVGEIAPAVVYLASDDSTFVTGSLLVIDGGYTAY
jgi:NAD(P)-dependent dehydrogenase (short-subunit alcohol dehydrogenase family)